MITGLYRHAVKGLSSDELTKVTLTSPGETFPDDRRFALLQKENEAKFDPTSPKWLHKNHFLCAFTEPKLMSRFKTSYHQILNEAGGSYAEPCDEIGVAQQQVARILTIQDRVSEENLLGPIDLATEDGRVSLANFFSDISGKEVICISSSSNSKDHKHQFGNTSSGVKQREDTRTVHIVNENSLKDFEAKIGVPLNASRFRPNIVVKGLEAWKEFDLVGHQICLGTTKLSIIKKTVRCDGISVDALDPDNILDIPSLMSKHYPTYGPYFGVYAVVDYPGTMAIGDTLVTLD